MTAYALHGRKLISNVGRIFSLRYWVQTGCGVSKISVIFSSLTLSLGTEWLEREVDDF
jgi:hypothetical protein